MLPDVAGLGCQETQGGILQSVWLAIEYLLHSSIWAVYKLGNMPISYKQSIFSFFMHLCITFIIDLS